MGKRRNIAIALGAAILVAALASPVPASKPSPAPTASPGPTLAPIGDGSASASAPSADASPGQPKVLRHIYTSAYCTNFVEHFNLAARVLISNDQHLDAVDTNLHAIEDDWNRTDGAMRVYQDRVSLIATVEKMLTSIPESQAAVNALLAQAKATTDPARKAALQESASQLQKTLDRQRAVTYDLTNVIHVLLDKHKTEDMAETNILRTLPQGPQYVNVNALDDPVPEPGTDTMMRPAPTPSPSPGVSPTPRPGGVEDIMQWTRQRWIIGNAESKAAVAADQVVRICNQETSATTP